MISGSIRTRIIGLLLALALPLATIILLALEREYRTSAERAEGAAAELAVATANGVEQILQSSLHAVQALSRDPAIRALDAPACAPWLREMTAMLAQFANIIVADSTGTIVCSASPLQGARPNVADRKWFSEAMSTGAAAIGRYQMGAVTGARVVVVAHPLLRDGAGPAGVVAAGVQVRHFQELLERLPQPPDAVVTLADDEWTVLARSTDPERYVGQTLPGDTVPERALAPGVGLFRATGFDRIERVFGFAAVRGPGWRVYAGVPEDWIYAPVREAALRRVIAVVAVLAAVAILAVLLFRRIAGSLWQLVDGTRRAAEVEGARVPESGPAEVVAIARQFNATLGARERAEADFRVAQERYAEHLLETRKMEAIARLAGGVAHDFNNLLTIVRGQAQLLQFEMESNALVQEHTTEIVNATERGARLTRQLLAFGRRQMVQPVALDMNLTVRSLQSMLRHVVGENVRVELQLEDGLPYASADPGQLEQIVLNLVFNARDAMPDGGVVRLETAAVTVSEDELEGRPGARPGDFVRLIVSDTGAGIPPELLDRVFEPFFTTKPHGQGTGLGLATVYGIVTQSGGWIDVASSPGAGSTFAVHLPCASGEPAVEQAVASPPHEEASGTVLVVEDEDAVRKVVVGALRHRGYAVLEAGDGYEALRVADAFEGELDLLVTDEMMPGMRGTQLAKEMLPRRAGLRVLFMSGYADKVPSGPTFDGAPSAFIAKPFSHEHLLSVIAQLMVRQGSLIPEG